MTHKIVVSQVSVACNHRQTPVDYLAIVDHNTEHDRDGYIYEYFVISTELTDPELPILIVWYSHNNILTCELDGRVFHAFSYRSFR